MVAAIGVMSAAGRNNNSTMVGPTGPWTSWGLRISLEYAWSPDAASSLMTVGDRNGRRCRRAGLRLVAASNVIRGNLGITKFWSALSTLRPAGHLDPALLGPGDPHYDLRARDWRYVLEDYTKY